ncbi:hypothetical protein ACWCSH_24030, partial [Streptosporangium sp. NPDC001682]
PGPRRWRCRSAARLSALQPPSLLESAAALAKATGGDAYIAKDVLEVRKFFLEGMKRRLCAPNC